MERAQGEEERKRQRPRQKWKWLSCQKPNQQMLYVCEHVLKNFIWVIYTFSLSPLPRTRMIGLCIYVCIVVYKGKIWIGISRVTHLNATSVAGSSVRLNVNSSVTVAQQFCLSALEATPRKPTPITIYDTLASYPFGGSYLFQHTRRVTSLLITY